MIKAIIFDFDGVIHNTFEFHWKNIMDFTNVNLSEEEFKAIHDGNFFDHQHKELENADWKGYRDYIYSKQVQLKMTVEVKDTLLELNQKYPLFIVTGAGFRNISNYLKNNEAGFFKEILGFEAKKSKIDKFNFIFDKYNLKPEECVFVTDTLGDILEANQVNVKTIAVDFGYHERERLEKGNPWRVISSFKDVLLMVGE